MTGLACVDCNSAADCPSCSFSSFGVARDAAVVPGNAHTFVAAAFGFATAAFGFATAAVRMVVHAASRW